MRVAVTGGKGGTGKSTVATALAVELGKRHEVVLADADVECPDDHLILSIERENFADVRLPLPVFDFKKCIKCGKCASTCRYNAIVQVKGKYPIFDSGLCNGCGACTLVCPAGAIGRGERKVGEIFKGEGHGIVLLSGEMEVGYEEASPVVSALKEKIPKAEFEIIDTAAGTHCNVISALRGCDYAVAVTEPTPFGAHDLELILRLAKVLGVPAGVVVNRSDLGKMGEVKGIAEKHGAEVIAEIPYSKEVLKSYSKGEPVTGREVQGIAKRLEEMLG
jgi:MinD superfamily P-loop ATPase